MDTTHADERGRTKIQVAKQLSHQSNFEEAGKHSRAAIIDNHPSHQHTRIALEVQQLTELESRRNNPQTQRTKTRHSRANLFPSRREEVSILSNLPLDLLITTAPTKVQPSCVTRNKLLSTSRRDSISWAPLFLYLNHQAQTKRQPPAF
jgi:hypothetical protein